MGKLEKGVSLLVARALVQWMKKRLDARLHSNPLLCAVHQLYIQIRQIQTWLYHLLAWRLKTGDLTEVQFLYLQNGDYRPLLTGLLWLSHRMVFAIASSTELSRQMNGKTTKTLPFHKKWKSLSFHIYK